mgnify:CR=1 FL=1
MGTRLPLGRRQATHSTTKDSANPTTKDSANPTKGSANPIKGSANRRERADASATASVSARSRSSSSSTFTRPPATWTSWPYAPPPQQNGSAASELKTYLETADLGRYADALVAAGCASVARLKAMPQVGTTGEQGYAEMDDNEQLVTLSAPAGTPAPVIARLESALQTTMKDPEIVKKLNDLDVQPTFVGSAEARKWLEKDVTKFSKVIKAAGLAVQQ